MYIDGLEKRVWDVMCSLDAEELSALDIMSMRYILRDRLVAFVGDEVERELNRPGTLHKHHCPCMYTTPCSDQCTCVHGYMSYGCTRCCRYGSDEQRKAAAEFLAKNDEARAKLAELQNAAQRCDKCGLAVIMCTWPFDGVSMKNEEE